MRIKFTTQYIAKVCRRIKKMAFSSFNKYQYDKSLDYIETVARINYNFNFVYTDLELENLLKNISSEVISVKEFKPIRGRFVFYDFYCAGKVLDLQYIRALISWGCEFLYIVERNDWNILQNVLPEVLRYDKAEVFELDASLSNIQRIQLAYNKIVEYRPQKAFLQIVPWDVIAVTLFNALPQIERYQINLTDHTFGLGVKCIDYSIEFRDLGCIVSQEKRGIPKERLLLQSYYPIIDKGNFEGFPKQVTSDKTVIFSGSSYYKIYGKAGMFFKMLKGILDMNSSVIILFAGTGDSKPFEKFIEENNYSERIILLGFRSDINEILENCDIYLDTYPLGGGLMAQLAAVHTRPILSYADSKQLLNDVESIVCANQDLQVRIACNTLESFLEEASKLIDDKEYRMQKGIELKHCVINPNDFNKKLYTLIMENKNNIDLNHYTIDYEDVADLYLEISNHFLYTFPMFMGSKFKSSILYLFPRVAMSLLLYLFINPRKMLAIFK